MPSCVLCFYFEIGSYSTAKLPRLGLSLWFFCFSFPECWHYMHLPHAHLRGNPLILCRTNAHPDKIHYVWSHKDDNLSSFQIQGSYLKRNGRVSLAISFVLEVRICERTLSWESPISNQDIMEYPEEKRYRINLLCRNLETSVLIVEDSQISLWILNQ